MRSLLTRIDSVIGLFRRPTWLDQSHRQDVLVVDEVGSDIVAYCLPAGIESMVVPVRGETAFVNFRILYFFIRYLPLRLLGRVSLLGLYIASVSRSVRAAVLVTFIDNSQWHKGVAELADVRIVFVQNGTRTCEQLISQAYDVFFPFGQCCQSRIQAKELAPVGSLKLGLSTTKFGWRGAGQEDLDLLFVSQLRMWDENKPFLKELIAAHKLLLSWLAQLVEQRGLRLGIAFNSFQSDAIEQERDFVRSHCDTPFTSFDRVSDILGCYDGLLRAKLVIAIGSTMLLEALGAGKKILVTYALLEEPARSYVLSGFPEHEFRKFLLSGRSQAAFYADVERLLTMEKREYRLCSENLRRTYCDFNKDLLPQDVIKRRIHGILSSRQKPVQEAVHFFR